MKSDTTEATTMRLVTRLGSLAVGISAMVLTLANSDVARSDGPVEHALFSSIRRGDQSLLASLLREGAPVNVHASDGTTPLMLATLHGAPDTVRLLLEHGADPNAANNSKATALLFAAGDLEKVRLLVDAGANVNARSSSGNTPLVAAAAHEGNLNVVKLLLNEGAELHAQNGNDVSVLGAAVIANDAGTVRFLLDQGYQQGAIKNLFGASRNSLLSIAAGNGNLDIVESLLARGADVNSGDSNFAGNALNNALLSQKHDIARRLIEAGADFKGCSPMGKVPSIVLAAYSETGDASVAASMIERGVDASAANQLGETALTWARRRGFPELIALLTEAKGADPADTRPTVPNRELDADPAKRAQLVRGAIEKSIALMQRSSDVFLQVRRTCVSCHHQNLPGVALGWARDRGFAVDEAALRRMNERQWDGWSRRVEACYEMDSPFPVPPQFLGYGFWQFAALGHAADSVTDATVWYLAAIQQADGHWTEGGVSRPPMGVGDILVTTLAMRSLQLYPLQGRREEISARIEKAKRWLSNAKPTLHQERVFKLLGLAWAGVPAERLSDDLASLMAAQRADGGWSQLTHSQSDAWATGQALVALRVAGGASTAHPAYQRGVDFLLRTQFDDGSWYVQSRAWPFQPPFDSGFPYGRDQWISAGATAWATMALLLTVEPAKPPLVPSRRDRPPTPVAARMSPSAEDKPNSAPAPAEPRRREQPVDFARDIKPVLERSCAGCHSGEQPEGGFRVTERAMLLLGGESGEAPVVAGRSDASPLLVRVSGKDPDLAMPPLDKRDKYSALSSDEVEALRAWIDGGATWPADVSIKSTKD
jgi:ankyrin repeat protein